MFSFLLLFYFSFTPGEELVYHVYYGFVGAGIAYLRVVPYNSGYKFQAMGHTNKFFSIIFYVKDKIETIADSGLKPLKQMKDLHEGTWSKKMWYIFNYDSMKVIDSEGKTSSLDTFAYDVLTLIFELRRRKLELNDTLEFVMFADKKIYRLRGVVNRKGEIECGIGRKKAIEVVLLVKKSGEYKGESGLEAIFGGKGGLSIWLSDDEKKIPLLISTRVWFGSVRAVLQEVRYDESFLNQK